ncbi:transcriptional regulator family: Fungal Specific TF [Aspergillus niger]|nr:transcriptional regulator family: Fungal Specific TF [Aspergillus niger]
MPPKSSGVAKQRTSRRKIALACDPCREKKIRCDGGKPICGSCDRKSWGIAQCSYSMDNPRTASQDEYIRVLRSRINELEDLCLRAGVAAPEIRRDSPHQKDSPTHETLHLDRNRNQQSRSSRVTQGSPVPQESNNSLHDERHADGQSLDTSGTVPSDHQAKNSLSLPAAEEASQRMSNHSRNNPNRNPLRGEQMYVSSQTRSASPHLDTPGRVTAMGQIATPDDTLASPAPLREYYGSSSIASLMRFARMSVPLRSSRSANGSPNSSMDYQYHESPNTQYRISDFTLPPRSLADHLLKCFWDRVACIYPFFDRPSFEKAYDNLWRSEREGMNKLPDMHIGLGGKSDSSPKSIVFYCALNVMFALGCHFSDLPLQEREATAHSFFLRCKRFVGLDLLEIHTVGVVQTLLIVALYLQSSPYPSRCWNAIGIACRLAQGLGLHEAHNVSSMTVLETEVRRRTWHGCVMLDVFVSMTHGRPSMTSHLAPIPLPYATGEDVPLTMGFYVATIKLYRILDRILSDVYNMWRGRMNEESKRSTRWSEGNFNSLLELERQLQYFKSNLPPYLSWSASSRPECTPDESDILERQRNILRSRYYYIRLLLYRPIFTQVCSDYTSPQHSHDSQKDIYPAWKDAESSLQSCIVKKCAATCVSTATELIHLIYETYSTSYTDAWWYNGFYTSTCALVLIMAHSVPSLSDSIDFSKVREAWEKCENILAHMATFSQSARTSLRFLQAAFSQNIHGRPSSKPSSNVGVNPDRNLTDEASAHYPVPDGPTNPSPFQDTPGLDSSYWTDSGIGPSTFEDDLGLLSWIDVPDMWQWLRAES